jgi:hypothetical protein
VTSFERAPHGTDDASEAAKEHRRCDMNSLVWSVSSSFGRLASTEKGQYGMRKIELHETLDRERSVLEQDGALQRLGVLNSVTS